MTYTLVTADDAVADLEEIHRYISEDSATRATIFVDAIRARARTVAARPLAFRLRTEVGTGVRAVNYRGYLLFYRVVGTEMRLLRVMHGSRDLSELTFD